MAKDFFARNRKPLAKMSLVELRTTEIMAESRRKTLERKTAGLAKKKQEIFDHGAKTTSPELRRTLAQQFDLSTTEELLVGRRLNIATKEVMIVARMRAVKQSSGEHATVRPADLKGLELAMDKDAVAAMAYQEILDEAMETSTIDEGEMGLSKAGRDVLAAWEGLDTGSIPNAETAMAEADKQTRERMAAATE